MVKEGYEVVSGGRRVVAYGGDGEEELGSGGCSCVCTTVMVGEPWIIRELLSFSSFTVEG